MTRNSSSASASGTVRPAVPGYKARSTASAAKAFQLFLRHRRCALRNSASSSEKDSNIASFEKSLAFSVCQSTLSNGLLTCLPPRVEPSDITSTLPLHRHLTSSAAVSKLAKLYKRYRNIERAVALFLLRRQLWRRTRRPTFRRDFIENLRRIQADEHSSDEETGLILTSVTTRAPRRPPSSSSATTVNISSQSDVATKRKHDPVAQPTAEPSPAAKKAKLQTPSPAVNAKGALNGTNEKLGILEANGSETYLKRRVSESDKEAVADRPDRNAKAPFPIPLGSQSTGPPMRAERAETSSSSRISPADPVRASPAQSNPAGGPKRMKELFERRVHEMLTDPLGFDDCVRDSARPTPRRVVREFARYRGSQTQPPPPLVMSGALRPMAEVAKAKMAYGSGSGSGGGGSKSKSGLVTNGSGGSLLAREAQKRAHRQKLEGRVQDFKGKGRAMSPERDGKLDGGLVNGGKQAERGKGKRGRTKERTWLTNARQKAGGGVQQGGQHSIAKKYTKSS
ncbi:hypothetical protein N657DRAFT_63607 [Parathielavia appendiculata]|uniref:Uncharacterized protein n=1 Tax=Parathielavia appendiculata TaxID=2587402 RepID=A0AAN6UB37_9PEZI|nr:hypothetical protein N657DRAFT_63607 [Parathielavia appendiculata]